MQRFGVGKNKDIQLAGKLLEAKDVVLKKIKTND